MILHLVDDEKFIDATIAHFESALPDHHIYLILGPSAPLKYIKNAGKIVFFDALQMSVAAFLENYSIESIFIHFLSDKKVDFVTAATAAKPLKLVWFFWGADGLDLGKLRMGLYDKTTYKLLPGLKKRPWVFKMAELAIRLFSKANIYPLDYHPAKAKKIKLIAKLDYIVPVVEGDYHLLKSKYATSAAFVRWNYLSIEQMFANEDMTEVSGDNILLGNSAHPTNNHIEIIDKLSLMPLGNRKVIVPLSYGSESYRDIILAYGKKKLGDSFQPLTGFLPLAAYNKIIKSCGYVIMNQNRQQAMGNIIGAVYLGAKIFLNGRSTMYNYFSDLGVKFYSIEEDITPDSKQLQQPLSEQDKLQNRTNIYKAWGKERIALNTKELIGKITNQV